MENSIKITLVGDNRVGKTNIIRKLIEDDFSEEYNETFGTSYAEKKMILCEFNNKEINLELQDTAGNPKYRTLLKLFLKDAYTIILVFDITNKKSFENVKNEWEQYLEENRSHGSSKIILYNLIQPLYWLEINLT